MSMDLSGIPDGWRPKEGDELIGEVTDITQGWSDYTDSHYPILVLTPEDGEPVAVHAFHQALRDRLVELRPRVGETVGIKFVGKQPTKDGKRTVAVYNVKVDGRSADAIWDQVGSSRGTVFDPEAVAADIPTD